MVKAALAALPLAETALFLREGPGGSLAGLIGEEKASVLPHADNLSLPLHNELLTS